jgi:hypothetical protein
MKVTFQITVDDSMAAELTVFLGKAQCGSETAACDHPRAIHLLNTLPKLINNAAAAQQRQVAGAGL